MGEHHESREAITQKLLEYAIQQKALTFGMRKLKSGRMSPYFFNTGQLASGEGFALLGAAYASTMVAAGTLEYDVLYGPAYKGIPLVTATSIALYERYGVSKSVVYNRKEVKNHGEGGLLVGESIAGKRLFLVDDVITAGTAVEESMRHAAAHGNARTQVVGGIVLLDRQERGVKTNLSAVQEVKQKFGFTILSVFTLDTLIGALGASAGPLAKEARQWLGAMREYRAEYGV